MIAMKDSEKANGCKGSSPSHLFLPSHEGGNTEKNQIKDGMTDMVKSKQGESYSGMQSFPHSKPQEAN